MAYYVYPPSTATGSGIPKYPTFASFPSPVTAGNGALAIALDTDILYISTGLVWQPIGGPGTVLGVGTFDSGSPSPNGAHIDSNLLIMQSASATNPGEVNIGTQTFAGNKTFTGTISAANLTGQNSGDASVVFRPGGVQGGVVYNNWSDLYAAIVTLDIAAVDVCFDDSISPITIPAGTYNLINVVFQAATGRGATTPLVVNLADGCVFTFFPAVKDLIELVSQSTTPIFTVPSSPSEYTILLQFAGKLLSVTGAPMITVPSGVTLDLVLSTQSTIEGVSGFPLIELQTGASTTIFLGIDSLFSKDTVSGDGSTTILVVVTTSSGTYNVSQANFTGSFFVQYEASITNIKVGIGLGDLAYASALSNGTILTANTTTTTKFLSETGTGTLGNAPVWSTLSSTDIPALTGDVTKPAGSSVTSLVATSNATLTTLSALTTATSLASVGTITTGTWNASTIAVNRGGTGVTSVTTSPTATAFAGWDANKNLSANNFLEGYTTTVTAGTTTTLLVGSTELQYFTGSSNQTVNLPVASTLVLGQSFKVVNTSSGTVLVLSSGLNTVQNMAANTWATFTCILASGTTAASWSVRYSTNSAGITALTGDVTATGPGSVAASLVATSNATLTTLSALTTASALVTVGTITTGTWNATTIAVNRGGTGLTSGTSGGILGFTGTTTLASSALLTADQLVVGGGAGATPKILAAGTANQYLKMNATPIPAWFTIPSPTIQKFTNPIYSFTITSATATAGATYTNNSQTFQLVASITSATTALLISLTGGAPAASGTLTSANGGANLTFSANTLSSGATSGTYTTPAGVVWLQVRMVGGGGGGAGGGSGSGGTGGTGGNTTFGSSLLTANGGPGAIWNVAPVAGGTATITAPAIGTANQGGFSSPGLGSFSVANVSVGGQGAASPFGGAGGGCNANSNGFAAIGSSGSGGGGGGTSSTTSAAEGGGGSAGGFIQAIIPATLSATYSYAIGAGGAGGIAGTSGFVGGVGGSGYIEVIEHYS